MGLICGGGFGCEGGRDFGVEFVWVGNPGEIWGMVGGVGIEALSDCGGYVGCAG